MIRRWQSSCASYVMLKTGMRQCILLMNLKEYWTGRISETKRRRNERDMNNRWDKLHSALAIILM